MYCNICLYFLLEKNVTSLYVMAYIMRHLKGTRVCYDSLFFHRIKRGLKSAIYVPAKGQILTIFALYHGL
jgi:hypothetical protein